MEARVAVMAASLGLEIARRLPDYDGKMDSSDANIIFYVTGAIVRSELRMRKCELCEELLAENGEMAPAQFDGISDNVKQFTEEINRGGLRIPSTLAFAISLKSWIVFSCIRDHPKIYSDFISCDKQQWLFRMVVCSLLLEDSEFDEVAVTKCSCDRGHAFCESLVTRFFNCMAKNLVKRLSNESLSESNKSDRKLKKLKSQCK